MKVLLPSSIAPWLFCRIFTHSQIHTRCVDIGYLEDLPTELHMLLRPRPHCKPSLCDKQIVHYVLDKHAKGNPSPDRPRMHCLLRTKLEA